MAVYDSLPPEATSGRSAKMPKQQPKQTPRQLLAKAVTPRKRKAEEYRPQKSRPATQLGEKDLTEKKKVKGFENNAKEIAKKQNIPVKDAKAILASGARKASPEAKRANPSLKRVSGKYKKA